MVDLTHLESLSVIVELVIGYSEHTAMARYYGEIGPGKGKINVCLRNHSGRQMTLHKWTAVGEIVPADAIQELLDLKTTGLEGNYWMKLI